MDVLQAVVLGLVQGVSEFLPISSSAHLVIVPEVLGWDPPGLAFDVLLHAATLSAVIAYFRRDLARMGRALLSSEPRSAPDRRLARLIVVATLPTVAVALLFGDVFEALFTKVAWVGFFLLVTSAVLVLAERLGKRTLDGSEDMTFAKAAFIGIAQGAAIAPGISRAGATISAGLAIGLDRERAARFSFLLSVPIILAATAKALFDVVTGVSTLPGWLPALAGTATAALTGYLAIAGLLAYLKRRSLYVFAAYTAMTGTIVLVWQYLS